MKYIGWFFGVFILSFGLFLLTPQKSLAPGDMIEGHGEFAKDCLKCHTPFSQTFHEKCIECHEPEKIGFFNTRGEKLPRPNQKFNHKSNLPCTLCHSEHHGTEIRPNLVSFAHAKLDSKRAKECQSCHKSPVDPVHRSTSGECAGCHTTAKSWKGASFDHSNARECATCHQSPRDRLHGDQPGECATCHNTQKWSEASIDHDRFFRLGQRRHNPPCATCHPGNNYRSYTCYGCHAHSERGVAREHQEEGIREYGNCVLCHRSGSEAEAKRNWRRLRQEGQEPSTQEYWGQGGSDYD